MNVPHDTYILLEEQRSEILRVIDGFDPEEYQKVCESRSLQQWLKLLEDNSDLIADFLDRNLKQRNSTLRKKYKDHWIEVHVLSLLALERCKIFLEEIDSFYLSPDKSMCSDFVHLSKALAARWNKIRLGYE